jgi:hypothetical protein
MAVMETNVQDSLMEQGDDIDVQQRCCEYCQHFQKDEYTGYCHIHHAYVAKTFWCARFDPLNSSFERT